MVAMLPWVKNVKVTMSAQPARPIYAEQLPAGLQTISNIVAVSSCKVGLCGRFCLLHILVLLYQVNNLVAFLQYLFLTFFPYSCRLKTLWHLNELNRTFIFIMYGSSLYI